MAYYLMLHRARATWRPWFGSTDPQAVADRMASWRLRGASDESLRMIAFGRVPTQTAIDQRVAALNGKAPLALPVATRDIEVIR